MASRFHAVQRGDWGFLVERWEEDMDRLELRRASGRVRREETDQEKEVRVAREAASLISRGHVGKAMRRLNSHGVASADCEQVLAQLRQKYPDRRRPLPDRVKKSDPIPSLGGLRQSLIKMKGGISPGCGGLRQEYLSILGQKLDDEGMARTEDI